METDRVCVRIVEDDTAVRRLFLHVLQTSGYAVRAYETAEQFMADDAMSEPGCVLVDLNLPGLGGGRLVDWIHRQADPLPTIVITGYGSVQAAVDCLRHGAMDFLEKPVDPKDMLKLVEAAIALDHKQRSERALLVRDQAHYAELSPREKEVFACLCHGKSSKQIASALNISIKTVEKHRAQVMTKMEAGSIAEVVRAGLALKV